MQKCEFKKGIFIQRACGQNAYHHCLECKLPVCSVHSKPVEDSANQVLCHSCYLSRNEMGEEEARAHYLDSDNDFALWYSSFRIEHTRGRQNFLFDEGDYHDFELLAADEQVYLEDDEGFFDS